MDRRAAGVTAGAMAVVAGLWACGDGTGPDAAGPRPADVSVEAGDGQSAVVGTELPSPLVVGVTDEAGAALAGVPVQWSVASGDGGVDPAVAMTDSSGRAAAVWTLGTAAGAQRATATVGTLPAAGFGATAEPDLAATVALDLTAFDDGDAPAPGDTTYTFEALRDSLAVAVSAADRFGNPVPGTRAAFELSDTTVVALDGLVVRSRSDGTARLTATVDTVQGHFLFVVDPEVVRSGAADVLIESGSGQVGRGDADLPDPIVARAIDSSGRPVAGAEVTASVTFGDGSLESAMAVTDSTGRARFAWRLGDGHGTQQVGIGLDGVPGAHATAVLQGSLDHWLLEHPRVARHVCWLGEAEGAYACWRDWDPATRHALAVAEDAARTGATLVASPVTNIDPEPSGLRTIVTADDAWDLYRAYVGQSLYSERSGELGWSVLDHTDHEIALLFHVQHFEGLERAGDDVRFWRLTPSSPREARAFLAREGLLGSSARETIRALFGWSYRMVHELNTGSYLERAVRNYGYAGAPLMASILEGKEERLATERMDVQRFQEEYGNTLHVHWTQSCRTTGALFNWMLRTVNIPTVGREWEFHHHLHLPTEGLALTHTDELYLRYYWMSLLIEHDADPLDVAVADSTWFAWAEDGRSLLHRRSLLLALDRLPNQMLRLHCFDLEQGLEGQDRHVFQAYNGTDDESARVSYDDFLEHRVWQRLDEKLAAIGGCENVPLQPFWVVGPRKLIRYP